MFTGEDFSLNSGFRNSLTKRGVIATRVAKGLLLHTVAPNYLGYRNLQRFLAGESVTGDGFSLNKGFMKMLCTPEKPLTASIGSQHRIKNWDLNSLLNLSGP